MARHTRLYTLALTEGKSQNLTSRGVLLLQGPTQNLDMIAILQICNPINIFFALAYLLNFNGIPAEIATLASTRPIPCWKSQAYVNCFAGLTDFRRIKRDPCDMVMNTVGPPNNMTIVEKSWTSGKATIYLLPQSAISFHTNKYDPSDSTRISSTEKIGQSGASILCRKRLTSCHRIEAL